MKKKFPDFDIYPVITEEFCTFGSSVETLKRILDCGVKVVQLREKDYSRRKIYEMALIYRKLTENAGTCLIINDHADIAAAVQADGIHLGQDDLPLAAARKAAPSLFIGISTHNLEEAVEAEKSGADYINIGPIYPTGTKKLQYPPVTPDGLKKIVESIRCPFTVMGGIKEHNLPELVKVGARRFAMVTELTCEPNLPEKMKRLRRIIHGEYPDRG